MHDPEETRKAMEQAANALDTYMSAQRDLTRVPNVSRNAALERIADQSVLIRNQQHSLKAFAERIERADAVVAMYRASDTRRERSVLYRIARWWADRGSK